MEQNKFPRRRVTFSEVLQQEDKQGDRQFPPLLNTESLKGIENLGFPWNMLRTGRESEPVDAEFAAAIAAAAFAVHSLEETRSEYQKKMMASFKDKEKSETSRPTSRRGSFEIADGSSRRRRSSEHEARELGREIMLRTNSTRSVDRPVEEHRRVLTKAEAWERDEMKKIDKRYRKMISNIKEWENERKISAKLLLETRKAELERLRNMATLHYQSKAEWIESVGRGAKSHLEDKKRSEETRIKAKARKIRSTGKLPLKCLCFEYCR